MSVSSVSPNSVPSSPFGGNASSTAAIDQQIKQLEAKEKQLEKQAAKNGDTDKSTEKEIQKIKDEIQALEAKKEQIKKQEEKRSGTKGDSKPSQPANPDGLGSNVDIYA